MEVFLLKSLNTHSIIFHLDVNSAYLSWTAAHRLQQGESLDLRLVPAVIGGSEASRHGIVLAKSLPAKAFGIQTGEPLVNARQKCPHLMVVPPNYKLYLKASNAMVELIQEYASHVQQFSVDECFIDYTPMVHTLGPPLETARIIQDRIFNELGFTVNIGISTNKLLAKMASDFQKPARIHTLYPDEIKEKLWPLPVTELFMVGRATAKKLHGLGIHTIGQLALADTDMLFSHFKSYAYLIQSYANGLDESPVSLNAHPLVKGMGNSTTIKFDVLDPQTAWQVLLSLAESVGMRLRAAKFCAGLVAISITTNTFTHASHQQKLDVSTDSTTYIYEIAKRLFDELWEGAPIRKLGLRVSELSTNEYVQLSFFNTYDFERDKKLDHAVDHIRLKFGQQAIYRATFLHSGLSPITGGIGEENYPVMTSIL